MDPADQAKKKKKKRGKTPGKLSLGATTPLGHLETAPTTPLTAWKITSSPALARGDHRDPHSDLSWLGISWKATGLCWALPDPGKEGATISTPPESPLIQPLPLLTPLDTR